METEERLGELLQGCVWVKDSGLALQILPTFAEDLPGTVPMAGQLPDGMRALPVACVPALAPALAQMLGTSGLTAARDPGAPGVDTLDDDALLADPLVAVLRDLFARAALPQLRAHAAPALAVAWATSRMLAGRVGLVPGVGPDDARAADALAQHLSTLDAVARGAALARVGWELSGRLGAALGATVRAGLPIPAGGLLRALVADRLTLAFPRGTLDRDLQLDVVGSMLGIGLDTRLLGVIERAAAAALKASSKRRRAGDGNPADLTLAPHLPAGDDARRALLHPVAGPLLVGLLGSLTTKGDLKKQGIDSGLARDLLRPAATSALAAAWGDLVWPLLRWDLHSSLVERVVPLWRENERWVGPSGPAPTSPRWDLLVPGMSTTSAPRAVVSVRLTELRAVVLDVSSGRDPLEMAGAVTRAWADLTLETGAVVQCMTVDHGVAAFANVEQAARFAVRAASALSGPRDFLAGPRDSHVSVGEGARVSVGVAWGPVRGGTDGERTWLGGAAVGEAIALTGAAGMEGVAGEPLGFRRASLGPKGVHSQGILASADFAAELLGGLRQTQASLHLAGEATLVGGLKDDFEFYPVRAWWDAGQAGIVVFLALDKAEGASIELQAMDSESLAGFHAGDADIWRTAGAQEATARAGEARAREADPSPADIDPFADVQAEVFTGPEKGGMLEPSVSFMGMGGSGESSGSDADDGDSSDGAIAVDEPPVGGSPGRFDGPAPFTDGPSALHSAMAILSGDDSLGSGDLDDDDDEDSVDDAPPAIGALALLDEDEVEAGLASLAPTSPTDVEEGPTEWSAAPAIGGLGTPSHAAGEGARDDRSDGHGSSASPSAPMMLDDEPELVVEPSPDERAEVKSFADPAAPMEGPQVVIEDSWNDSLHDEATWEEPGSGDAWSGATRDTEGGRTAELNMLQSGFGGDMELIGVAGFSLQDRAPNQGQGHGASFDVEEHTGFFDERGREVPPQLTDEPVLPPQGGMPDASALTELEASDSSLDFADTNRAVEQWAAEDVVDDLMSDQGLVALEAGGAGFKLKPEAEDGGAADPVQDGPDDAMLAELMRMFKGHLLLEDDGDFTFGLRDGGLLRDAHTFATQGDAVSAYRQFLEAKISEGFIPRPDRIMALLPDANPRALDEWLIQRAYAEIKG